MISIKILRFQNSKGFEGFYNSKNQEILEELVRESFLSFSRVRSSLQQDLCFLSIKSPLLHTKERGFLSNSSWRRHISPWRILAILISNLKQVRLLSSFFGDLPRQSLCQDCQNNNWQKSHYG